ncbi:MAG: repeat-associated core domain protein [Ferruginibacter sp.]|nr:repeat-associated core domain protein [Ferruginibacter sp.]
MGMVGRKYSAPASKYRYGFNGKENDNEVKGEGNQQDYGMRIYDVRLGKFLSVDPLSNSYPFYSPYQFAGNDVMRCVDLDGEEPRSRVGEWDHQTAYLNGPATFEVYDKVSHQIFQATGVVDPATGKTWIVADDGQSQNKYFYLVNDNKSTDRLQHYASNGRNILYGGHFERFETRDEIDAKDGAKAADAIGYFVVGIVTSPAVLYGIATAAPAIKSLAVGSWSERGAAGLSDGIIQYASNVSDHGWGADNLNHINLTSIIANAAFPNANFTSSFVSNAFETNLADGYNGVGSANASTRSILVNSLAGGIGNKLGAGLDKSISKYILKGQATTFYSKLATENIGNVLPIIPQEALKK